MNKEEYLQLAESLEVQNPDKVIETKVALEPGEVVYAEVDGSMIFTDDKWREVKVGRLFRQNDCAEGSESRSGSIKRSQYVAYLGNYQEFACRFGS